MPGAGNMPALYQYTCNDTRVVASVDALQSKPGKVAVDRAWVTTCGRHAESKKRTKTNTKPLVQTLLHHIYGEASSWTTYSNIFGIFR